MDNIDFGRAAGDYARYRAGFPTELFRRLSALAVGVPGQRLLDMGSGTGTLARGFAARGCDVIALDRSPALLAAARELARAEGVQVTPVQALAEDLPFPAVWFDVVSAGQCWHWFDRARAADEAYRVLKPGGKLVLAHFDWIPLPGNVVEATEALIIKYNPPWADLEVLKLSGSTGMYRDWLTDLALAGFTDLETFSFDVHVPYTHEGWRGRIRASAGVAAAGLSPDTIAAFDAELQKILEERFPAQPVRVHHRVFAVVGTRTLSGTQGGERTIV